MSNMKNKFYKNDFILEIIMGLFSYIATSCQNKLLYLRKEAGNVLLGFPAFVHFSFFPFQKFVVS